MAVEGIGIRQAAGPRVGSRLLFGFQIDAVCMEQALARCRTAIRARQSLLVGVLNAAKIVHARRDMGLRDALLDCNMLLADGQSVVWASRLLRRPLPERVAGIDLFEALLELANQERARIYLLGAKPEVLCSVENRIAQLWPQLQIVGSHHGYFNEAQAPDIAANIRAAGADMLFVGMGSPKKEVFLRRFHHVLDVPVLHGVGGAFDVLAGLTKRAPRIWQQLGLEWAYRLLQEPGRLWKRYAVTNAAFIALTVGEAIRPAEAYFPPSPLEPFEEQPHSIATGPSHVE